MLRDNISVQVFLFPFLQLFAFVYEVKVFRSCVSLNSNAKKINSKMSQEKDSKITRK